MLAYYGTVLSDHITRKPNGGIVRTDVSIARTGVQEYFVRQHRAQPRLQPGPGTGRCVHKHRFR